MNKKFIPIGGFFRINNSQYKVVADISGDCEYCDIVKNECSTAPTPCNGYVREDNVHVSFILYDEAPDVV